VSALDHDRRVFMTAFEVCTTAVRRFLGAWRLYAAADLAYRAAAFVVLTPLATLLLRFLMWRSGRDVVADTDILAFFVTSRPGFLALILWSSVALAINALGQASLMTVGIGSFGLPGRGSGTSMRVRDAIPYAAAHAVPILRLTFNIVIRLIGLAAPFLLALGLVYRGLLGEHDINFYLADRPPAFWTAVVLAGTLVALLAWVVLPRAAGWVAALPLLLFEGVHPRRALGASAKRLAGHRWTVVLAIGAWAGAVVLLSLGITAGVHALGRAVAPVFGGSITLILLFVGLLAIAWAVLLLSLGVVGDALFALLVVGIYERSGATDGADRMARAAAQGPAPLGRLPVSWRALGVGAAAAFVITVGLGYLLLRTAWIDREVLVIAHRGASAEAPENTLAAFRRAIVDRADFVELDVQETVDGVVVVVHDSDLMKIGGSPLKIWEATAAQLRDVDIGSRISPDFSSERVPTLAEALDLCKGKVRVDIELKSYGHDQKLEERVIEIVEAAGVEREIVTMSLDHDMVHTMKRLRPEWTAGVLTAKVIGDLTKFPADFLAVESKIATRRFVRRAHRAGKAVYVWTVNDPAAMLDAMSFGVDGLITDQPAVAREVVDRYAALDQSQRLLVALLVRFGKRSDFLAREETLRP
jgi:glycerophosphoryl diester phosphodiesterase